MKVVVAGLGVMGFQIAEALKDGGNDVVGVELDHDRAETLRDRLDGNLVEGDCCEPAVLERAGIDGADAFVALTGRDEDNLVASLLAKSSFGVKRVVARINDPRNSWLYDDRWGVDVAMSAPSILLSLVQEATAAAPTVNLMDLATAGVRVVETSLGAASPLCGSTVGSLKLPSGVIVSAVIRSGRAIAAEAGVRLEPGDQLLLVAPRGAELEDAF